MARIGMRYPRYAVVTVTTDGSGNETETYGTVKTMGKAISASSSITFTSNDLYADDGKAESVREFSSGTVTINTDDIENENLAELTGATLTSSGDIDAGADDTPPYVRLGYVRKRMKNGVSQYGGIIYKRVKFTPPNEEDNTKGESITFGTPTMTGDLSRAADGKWRITSAWKDTEAAALTWLDTNLRPQA